ncbi:unnamed protein product, partial [Nesidiocoris tenuis]
IVLITDESAKDEDGFTIKVTSGNERWQIHRTYEHFCRLDEQLHQCVFDRKFSDLPQLSQLLSASNLERKSILDKYVQRLTFIWPGCAMSCGPVLSWFELDNRGRRIVASGHGINTPAVAAAFATTPYTANATDELSFQIDIRRRSHSRIGGGQRPQTRRSRSGFPSENVFPRTSQSAVHVSAVRRFRGRRSIAERPTAGEYEESRSKAAPSSLQNVGILDGPSRKSVRPQPWHRHDSEERGHRLGPKPAPLPKSGPGSRRSPRYLSELQMNFELEESEMRIFSEDETNQLFSSGASIAFGVLENDMNLEKRFSTQNLRYIDSYSPDPMDSPSDGAQTPGYQPLVTPGSYENLRVSSCFDSASSRKSDGSTFTYEKLMESPNNALETFEVAQRCENDLYEPCTTPDRDSAVNVYESMEIGEEQEIYEPVANPDVVQSKCNIEEGADHYENGAVARAIAAVEESQNNIYEDISCASATEIYEQLSNFRNSVNEVNSLANDGHSTLVDTISEISNDQDLQHRRFSESLSEATSTTLTPKMAAAPPTVKTDSPPSTLSSKRSNSVTLCEESFPVRENSQPETSSWVGGDDSKDVERRSPERDIVPESIDLEERSDATSKTYYQNVNLSAAESGDGEKADLQADQRPDEPKLNDNLIVACDSNLSDRSIDSCDDNNDIIDSNFQGDTTALEESPSCVIVSEFLKRENVADRMEEDAIVPFDVVDDRSDRENSMKFVEIQTPSLDGSIGGARSKLRLSLSSSLSDTQQQPSSIESDLERRERIERYKEERRNFFRNKYKTDALNNNDERDDELIRRIKQRTKKDPNNRTVDLSPAEDGAVSIGDFHSKKSPSKTMMVNISYSPTKAKADSELDGASPESNDASDS